MNRWEYVLNKDKALDLSDVETARGWMHSGAFARSSSDLTLAMVACVLNRPTESDAAEWSIAVRSLRSVAARVAGWPPVAVFRAVCWIVVGDHLLSLDEFGRWVASPNETDAALGFMRREQDVPVPRPHSIDHTEDAGVVVRVEHDDDTSMHDVAERPGVAEHAVAFQGANESEKLGLMAEVANGVAIVHGWCLEAAVELI